MKQKKVLSLFHVPTQVDVNAEYYKIGTEFSIEANIDCYTVSITKYLFNLFNW